MALLYQGNIFKYGLVTKIVFEVGGPDVNGDFGT